MRKFNTTGPCFSTDNNSKWWNRGNCIWKYLPDEYQDWEQNEVLERYLQDENFKQGLINSIVDIMKEIVEVVQQVK